MSFRKDLGYRPLGINEVKLGIVLLEDYLNKHFIDKFSNALLDNRVVIEHGLFVAKYHSDLIKEYETCLEFAKQLEPLAKKLLDYHKSLECLMLNDEDSQLITKMIYTTFNEFYYGYELLDLHIKQSVFILNCLLDDDLMINDLLQKTSRR